MHQISPASPCRVPPSQLAQ